MRLFRRIVDNEKKPVDPINSSSDPTSCEQISSPFIELDCEEDVCASSLSENIETTSDKVTDGKSSIMMEEEDELSSSVKKEFRQTVQKYRKHAEEGFVSLTIAAFLGAAAIIFSSIQGFQEHGRDGFSYNVGLITLFSCLSGGFIVGLEGRIFMIELPSFHQFVSNYLRMLRFLWGRGLFYIFAGSLHICLMAKYSKIAGVFLISVGLITVFTALVIQYHLKKLTYPSLEHNLTRTIFDFYDIDKDGHLCLENFRDMTIGLGIEGNESDAEFEKVDVDKDGLISYTETRNWFQTMKYTKKSMLDDFDIMCMH